MAAVFFVITTKPSNTFAFIGFEWQPIPLKTEAQARNDLPGGEGFQKIMAIEFSSSEPDVVYMATDQSQVWKSNNAGFNWTRCNHGFYAQGARSIGVDPNNSNIVIAAGFVGKDFQKGKELRNKHQGIYITTNGGDSWNLTRKTDFFKQPSKGSLIAFIENQSEVKTTQKIVVGSYSEGLLFSDDGGKSWNTPGLLSNEKVLDIEIDNNVMNRLLVATEQGLYEVIHGVSKKIGKGLPSYPRNVAINNKVTDMVYAVVGNHGVYISRDGGKNFTSSGTGLPFKTNFTEIEASPVNGNIVYIKAQKSRNKKVYYSHNGGVNWYAAQEMNKNKLMPTHAGGFFSGPIAASPREEKNALHAANGQDNILSTNNAGRNWRYSGNGFSGGRMRDIEFVNDTKMVFSLTDFGLWETLNTGNTFKQLETGRLFGRMSSRSLAINDENIIASLGQWHKKGLAISHDSGKNWRYESNEPGRFENIVSSGNTIYAGNLVSHDNGKNWQKVAHNILAVHPVNKNIVYGIKKIKNRNIIVIRSIDSGQSWNSVSAPVLLSKKSIRGMAISKDENEKIFLATLNGIYLFSDKKWTLINHKQGLKKDHFGMTAVYCIAIDPDNQKRIFAGRWAPAIGRSNGVFMSEDSGKTWKNITNSLMEALTVFAIKIDSEKNEVYIGTSHGTFKASYKNRNKL